MRLEKAQLRQEWDSDRKKNRRRILLGGRADGGGVSDLSGF